MLPVGWIQKDIEMHSDEWRQMRLAKFTASKFDVFYPTPEDVEKKKPTVLTPGMKSYLLERIGEELTGVSADKDIDTDATRHGNLYELEGLKQGLRVIDGAPPFAVVTQRLIHQLGSRLSATPDALRVMRVHPDGNSYEAETVEVKCPSTFAKYGRMFLCETPQQVWAEDKQMFTQVLFQMHLTGSLVGYLVIYHPLYRIGNLRVIKFRKVELREAFRVLEERLKFAEEKFLELRSKFLSSR